MSHSAANTRCRTPLLESLEPRLLLDAAGGEQALQLFSTAPAVFAENRGQWADEAIRYAFDGAGANVGFTAEGPVFQVFRREPVEEDGSGGEGSGENAEGSDPTLPSPLPRDPLGEEQEYVTQGTAFRVRFDGANPTEPVGLGPAETRFSYCVGDQSRWRVGVPTYETIRYEGLYDGIDLYTWGRRDSLKYEFHVAPGADWRDIRVSYSGIEGLSLDEDGALHVETELGDLVDAAPVIYQEAGGERVEVAGTFSLADADTYTFEVTGAYDPMQELIIDPDLAWSIYLGGSGEDYGFGTAPDRSGGALVIGHTLSTDFSGVTDSSPGGGDAFVARVTSNGSLAWATYLGGSNDDLGYDIVSDKAGGAFVTGHTLSTDFFGCTAGEHSGYWDAFAARVTSDGSLAWATYLGGSGADRGYGVAADGFGGVFVTGFTESSNFCDCTGNYQGRRDAFAARLNSGGAILWATYLGGTGWDWGFHVAGAGGGGAFVAGYTESSDFPGRIVSYRGGGDCFVARVTGGGSLLWANYLLGSGQEVGYGVAADGAGGALVTGKVGAVETNAFAARLTSAGSLLWSTYLGGSGCDEGRGIAANGTGGAFVTGWTGSSDFAGATGSHHGGSKDAFVARVTGGGSLGWATYLGGSNCDWGYDIAVDGAGGAFVAGYTESTDFAGATNSHHGGDYDAFLARVTGGGALNLPDLALSKDDLVLTPEGDDQRVTATVHNRGAVDAAEVAVRFRDPETGLDTAETIPSIAPFASEECSVVWTPSGPGAQIEVTADPWDEIEEETEANNAAEAFYGASGGAPEVSKVTAAWDGDGAPDVFGRFVSGVDLWNTFTASVLDPDGAGDVGYVDFTLGPLGAKTDDDPLGGWTAEFNLGELAGDTTLQVVAYDAGGQPSDPWTGTVHAVPFPAWLGEADEDDYFGEGHYHLNGFFPEELDVTHTMPSDWWIVGGKESGFRLGAELGVTAGLDADTDVPVDHAFVFEAKVLDHELFGFGGDPFSFSAGDHVTLSFSALADGQDLSLSDVSAELDVDAFPLYQGSVVGPSMTVFVPVGPVPIPMTVSSGVNFGLTVDGELDLGWNVSDGELEVLGGSYFQPNVSAEPYLFGGVGIPVLNAGLEVGGELGLHYRGEYAGSSPYEDYLWGSFALNFRAVATVGVKSTLAEWTVPAPDDPQWVFGNPPPGGMMLASTLGGDGQGVVLPEPSVAADGAGNVLLARVVDSDADPDAVEADIFYAARDSGGTWSALSPVAGETTIDSDPAVAFDGQGGAVASWVANPTDPAEVDPEAWDAYLAEQEIHSAYWDGSSWGPVQAVTADERMDGPPEVAFHDGRGLMVWEHATTAESTNPDDYEIHYAVWDDATHAWGEPQALTSDAEGDWAPQVAFGPTGDAMAAWVHDDDGDPTTADLHYATWDGASWSTPAAVPLASTEGVREPRLAFDSGGDAMLAWIGNEGAEDLLHTATWDGSGGSWSSPEVVGGTPGFIEGLDLAISLTDEAMLTWHGWDGQHDLFSTVCDLAGAGDWTPPARVTDNADGEWMASTAFDAAGVPVTVWANEAVTTAFGEGAEGVELALAPDLAIADVTVDAFQPVEGQEARLYADVVNEGWHAAEATTLTFYIGDPHAGGTAIGSPVDVEALAVGDATTVMSEVFALPAGGNDYYAVVASVADEADEANNMGSTPLESLPPDVTGPQVVLELPEGGVLREGTSTLALTFDEPVAWLDEPHVSLVEATEGVMPPDHVYLSPDGQEATLIFEGGLPAAAAADTYTLRVLDSVRDGAGNALDGDADDTPGGDYQVAFTVALNGDTDYDGRVNIFDLLKVRQNYLKPADDPERDDNADVTGDGSVNIFDLLMVRQNYLRELEGPAGAALASMVLAAEGLPEPVSQSSESSGGMALTDYAELSVPTGDSEGGTEPETVLASVSASPGLFDSGAALSALSNGSDATLLTHKPHADVAAPVYPVAEASEPPVSEGTDADRGLADVLAVPPLDVPLGA